MLSGEQNSPAQERSAAYDQVHRISIRARRRTELEISHRQRGSHIVRLRRRNASPRAKAFRHSESPAFRHLEIFKLNRSWSFLLIVFATQSQPCLRNPHICRTYPRLPSLCWVMRKSVSRLSSRTSLTPTAPPVSLTVPAPANTHSLSQASHSGRKYTQ